MFTKRRTKNTIECFDCLKPSCVTLNKTLTTLNCKECKAILEKNFGFQFKDFDQMTAAEKEDAIMDAAGNENQFNIWMGLWVPEKYPLPTSASQKLKFFTEKYGDKIWVSNNDYADACRLMNAVKKVPSAKIRGFGSADAHEIDIKSFHNPYQMNSFGPYQNLNKSSKSPVDASSPKESSFSQPSFVANFHKPLLPEMNASADATFTIPLKKALSQRPSYFEDLNSTSFIQPPPSLKASTVSKPTSLYANAPSLPPALLTTKLNNPQATPLQPLSVSPNLFESKAFVEDKYAAFRSMENSESSFSVFSTTTSNDSSNVFDSNSKSWDFHELRDTKIGGLASAKIAFDEDDGFGDFQSSANTDSKPKDLLHQGTTFF